tara:strand:+ start:3231 stop:4448 length:1218 start_codon:yes stop_codon:yes gene_type:complete
MNINATKQSKKLFTKLIGLICLSSVITLQAKEFSKQSPASLNSSYLESKNELQDYILDTGDILNIEFKNIPEFSGLYTINEQGEIFFERLRYKYVRGLTIDELTKLLEYSYEEFLVKPEILIRVSTFKPIRISVSGEVRSPGLIKFPAFISVEELSKLDEKGSGVNSYIETNLPQNQALSRSKIFRKDSPLKGNNFIKENNDYVTTLSNALKEAGGLTSYSDVSKIEIIRDIPLQKGGGRKKAILDFTYYVNNGNSSNDIRLYDGDSIFVPRLQKKDPSIIPNSILSGLSPKFMSVSISGKIENPGTFIIPIEGSLLDVMNLSGPRKPLSGKIFLIRYQKDGTLLRKNIRYSANAEPGSKNNPFLKEGDLITIKNSIFGRASGTIKTITEPFIGIYTTKELINNF